MYTTPPPRWGTSRNGDALITRRGATAWDKRLAAPSSPAFKKLAYFNFGEKWGDRIPSAPVIGNPVSSINAERLYNDTIREGLGGGFFSNIAKGLTTATQWVGHRILPRPVYKFAAKSIRYAGASGALAPFSPLMSASSRARMFGLSAKESSQFETVAKVERGVAIAAGAYLAAPYVLAGAKAAGAGLLAFGGKVFGSKGNVPSGGPGTQGQDGVLAAAGAAAGEVVGTVAGAGGSFAKGYRETAGQNLPSAADIARAAGEAAAASQGSQSSAMIPTDSGMNYPGPSGPSATSQIGPQGGGYLTPGGASPDSMQPQEASMVPSLGGNFWAIAGGLLLFGIVMSKRTGVRRRSHA